MIDTLDIIKTELVKKDLYEFVKEFWDTCDMSTLVEGSLIEYLCEVFVWSVRKWLPDNVTEFHMSNEKYNKILKSIEGSFNVLDVRAKDVQNYNFNMPPGHTKSMILNVLGPCWLFAHTGVRIASVSHTEPLATSMNRKRQRVINSDKWKKHFPNITLIKDEGKTLIGSHHGELYSATMAGFTGYSAEVIINDDIVNAQQARKDKASLANAVSYYRDTMPSRIRDQSRGVIWNVQQRLAPNDISGFIQKTEDISRFYNTIVIQAQAEDDITIIFPITGKVWHMKKGDFLWPERFGNYEQLKATQGNAVWETQYQQNPMATGSTYVNSKMIHYMTETEAKDIIENYDNVYGSHDFPIKDKQTSDNLGSILAYKKGNILLIVDRMLTKMAYVKSRQYVINLSQTYRGIIQIIEDTANGAPILQDLSSTIAGLIGYTPGGNSKAQRLESASVWMESKNVYFLTNYLGEPSESIQKLVEQLVSYPMVESDDDIDAFSQLVNYVYLHKTVGMFDKALDDNNYIDEVDLDIYKERNLDAAVTREGTNYKVLKVHYDYTADTFYIIDDLTFRASAEDALNKIKEYTSDCRMVIDATKDNILYNMYLSRFGKILSNTDIRPMMEQFSQLQAGFSMNKIKYPKEVYEFRQDLDSISLDAKVLKDTGIEKLTGNEGLISCLRVLVYTYKGRSNFF